MKILVFICFYFALVSASKGLEVSPENNVAKKDDKSTSFVSTSPVFDVSKQPNLLVPPTATSHLSSISPATETIKSKDRAIRPRRPSHRRTQYRHKSHKQHARLKIRKDKRPIDLRHRRPKYHYHKVQKKIIHHVPKEM